MSEPEKLHLYGGVAASAVSVAYAVDGRVLLRLDVLPDFAGIHLGDKWLTPDEADAVAESLKARAMDARMCLLQKAEETARKAREEAERLAACFPDGVPPDKAREAAEAVLAKFDVAPKDAGAQP